MTLTEQFTIQFANKQTITTKEIYEWYCNIKQSNNEHTYRNVVHALIIDPLLKAGRLIKVNRGVYQINNVYQDQTRSTLLYGDELNEEELDEFDLYIKNKIKGGIT